MAKEPIKITDADEEEWHDYDEIKVTKGLEYVPKSLKATEWIERTDTSPCTMIDTPWPNSAWLGVAEIIKEQMRKTAFPELRESRAWAYIFCMENYKSGVEGRRPAHEQFTFMDMLRATDARGQVDKEAMRSLKDAIYLWHQREYMGRAVG